LHVPLAHWVPEVHACPDASLQAPAPSHACVPLHPVPVVPSAGYWHKPVVIRQAVAPHGAVTELHADAQQTPVPFTPHTLFRHWSFAPQSVPVPTLGRHDPALGPVSAQYIVVGSAQSPSPVHEPMHAVWPAAQARLFAQGTAARAVQSPVPSHELFVIMFPGVGHDGVPQARVLSG
jgi:hypothetical protein